jgi:hypothetical protein
MKTPEAASDDDVPVKIPDGNIPGTDEKYIPNPFPGREVLTRFEAMDAINLISAALMADERFRSGR